MKVDDNPDVLMQRMLRVEGAGIDVVNGFFAADGEVNGKHRWRHTSANVWLRFGSDSRWCFVNNPAHSEVDANTPEYFYNTGAPDPLSAPPGKWQADEHGLAPMPKIFSLVGGSGPWPAEKLATTGYSETGIWKATAAIVTTGGMNPVHCGHVQLLHQAKSRLEADGYCVVGLWISPSHDAYLQPKAKSLSTIGLSDQFRIEAAKRAVLEDMFVSVGSWEAERDGGWPDFPEVADALQESLNNMFEKRIIRTLPQVFYACGTDHALKCDLYSGEMPVVIVPRQGEIVGKEQVELGVFVAEPAVDDAASFSSTKIRNAIAANDYDYVKRSMSRKAADFLLSPSFDEYHKFPDDFAKLGVKLVGRKIYISLSSIFKKWDAKGPALLSEIPTNALFFFGSKRSWVFPENESELKESQNENPKYTSPEYQQIRDLILEKEADDRVFFLKPPGFVYNGELFHGHPDAFPVASQWLVRHVDPLTGKDYSPLLLEPTWWSTEFKPEACKYTKAVQVIIKNFQNGAHDYAPVMELLYQSNPTLDIVK